MIKNLKKEKDKSGKIEIHRVFRHNACKLYRFRHGKADQ